MQDCFLVVVPAKAGTHTPRPHYFALGQDDFPTTNIGGYGSLLPQGRPTLSHRHLAMPYRRAGGETFGGVDDGVGVDAVVAIEVIDGAGLAEMLDTERFDAVAVHAAEPAQCRRMAVDHGHDARVARKRRTQFLDMAEMRHPAPLAPQLARRGPSGMKPVGRGHREQTYVA